MDETERPRPMLAVFMWDDNGTPKEWTVGCMSTDTTETMHKHFHKWMPGRKLISLAFEEDIEPKEQQK